jgi:hypothetical protein
MRLFGIIDAKMAGMNADRNGNFWTSLFTIIIRLNIKAAQSSQRGKKSAFRGIAILLKEAPNPANVRPLKLQVSCCTIVFVGWRILFVPRMTQNQNQK